MNRLVEILAKLVQEKVQRSVTGQAGAKLESRFIFHGPPRELLEQVFDALAIDGGIRIEVGSDAEAKTIPVLLVLPVVQVNPDIGVSGKCDENHLLHIRNDPNSASFVALLPPGQHSSRSVASTTDEFGISASNNTGHATFEEWWDDGFVQNLVDKGLDDAGISSDSLADSREIVKRAAMAVDEAVTSEEPRSAAWRLLSRIYSINEEAKDLLPGSALALACGFPPIQDGSISARFQMRIQDKIANEMEDGFRTGVKRLASQATDEVREALSGFLAHVEHTCQVSTAFERSMPAFYLPSDALALVKPESWWSTLTCESWSELLADEPDEISGDLSIECTNAIFHAARGMPSIVQAGVELSISTGQDANSTPVDVLLTGGGHGRTGIQIPVDGSIQHFDNPPVSGQRSPISYKVAVSGRKPATTKVVSMAGWIPGILVVSRMATKFTPPKKPRKGNAGADWESTLSLPGSGRYELLIFVTPGTQVTKAEGVPDDATESMVATPEALTLHEAKQGIYQVEIDAEEKYQLEISFQKNGSNTDEIYRVFITCEETKEEGCRSEFERLIKLNRRPLEKFDTKAVVQLDRHARLSAMQSWMLDENSVSKSFIPIVISDDYASKWASPDWGSQVGPILSQARFLHDPRPPAELFIPPKGFVDAREEIAKRIRETSDGMGLVESSPLGKWLLRDPGFLEQVESYLDAYMAWITADRNIACWVDLIAVCPREADGRTLGRIPEAIILSPLHPLRLAWHCLAQKVLYEAVEGDDPRPCPAASILDPDCVPDILEMSLQSPGGPTGIDRVAFLSVECNSDYWSVLWNGKLLDQIASKSRKAPFDDSLGLIVGGISSGFSPAQVARSLEDVSDLLAAKPIIGLVVSSGGGATDACNEGLATWCSWRFGRGEEKGLQQGVGPRMIEVFDIRPESSRPDQAMIANLSEDTGNRVRWFERQPPGARPDLGIIAQLDSAQPESRPVGMRSPLGIGGLVRHRIRRQLHGSFLSESRQSLPIPPTGDVFCNKIACCINLLESGQDEAIGLQFSPNVHAVSSMLEDQCASFVAVSSSAIDPACFLGGWIKGTYLWDYDLPSYSHRAGDTSGYYLLSQVREADRDALGRVLCPLPGCEGLDQTQIEQILLEVARRGIPTVRGLSGDDTGATGDLGLFVAARLLQDQFRTEENKDSLLPVLSGTLEGSSVALIIPVDPFRSYLADLSRSLGRDKKETSLSRPDLLVIGIRITEVGVRLHLTPIEVKFRNQGSGFASGEAREALAQARALTTLLKAMVDQSEKSIVWKLAYQHLLLSMIGFGLRVYSQHEVVSDQKERWSGYHERIAAKILDPDSSITIDESGRLLVVDGTPLSDAYDHDGDGFSESISISPKDAGKIVGGDPQEFYEAVRSKVGDWRLMPALDTAITTSTLSASSSLAKLEVSDGDDSAPVEPDTVTVASPAGISMEEAKGDQAVDALPDTSTPLSEEQGSGILLSVGKTIDGFEPRQLSLNISDTRLNQLNIGVVGDLGTGKTQLLKSLIFQIATSNTGNRGIKPRFLIFDYKRDYSSPEFVNATGARVVRPSRLPLNLFDTSSIGESMAPWLDRFRFFADVLDKVYSGIGPVQRDKLKGAVRSAYETCSIEGRQPTIYDIHSEYRALLNGKSDSPMAIIDDLVDMEVFEKDPAKTKAFDDFLDGIVVISLDAMGQDDRSKNMLVAIMLNMFYENMLKTPKRPFQGSDPQLRVIDSYLLVDEADNIMRYEFDVLRKLLLQGREFGAGVILASQYLRHFKASTTDYKEPLLTWFIHKVPNVAPAELSSLGLTSDLGDLSERVKALPNHHCLYKSFDSSGEVIRGLPFYELDKKP
ncbi:hypothetical protein QWA_10299 [Alcaligenes faecalis subsp. faecalis NCIB 8687]|uniref:hypothetical protein n=1 Tax=Alcaligenes faecalis TaxID=511 RepID=UPI000269EAC1|nr:hypothetical protein [Alcaligenes faecalis]EJC62451.1 hypothetical protein QWA_10299 [Alcaligenes faecalis subsp. faecalis NCIB 8687]RSE63659.1 ATP-binding protein [Alcaligenes faecalis]